MLNLKISNKKSFFIPKHPFHIVDASFWPFFISLARFTLLFGSVKFVSSQCYNLIFLGLFNIILTLYLWWERVITERTFLGFHTNKVQKNIKWGIILFIVSEIIFFLSFFIDFYWAKRVNISFWGFPQIPFKPFLEDPFEIPFLNTIILLSSGITVTWAHHSIIKNKLTEFFNRINFTLILGIFFLLAQYLEYCDSFITIADGAYPSIFFLTTGFHGFHVIIGFIFLTVTLVRFKNFHFSSKHHLGFEIAAWYWHFVDVVWLFLFLIFYLTPREFWPIFKSLFKLRQIFL